MKIVGSIQDQEIEKKTRQCDRYIPRFFFNVAKVLSLVFILKSNEASVRLYICPSLHYLGNYPVHIMHWPPLMYVPIPQGQADNARFQTSGFPTFLCFVKVMFF